MQPPKWTEATHVDPSAGSHAITADYDELQAARRAGECVRAVAAVARAREWGTAG